MRYKESLPRGPGPITWLRAIPPTFPQPPSPWSLLKNSSQSWRLETDRYCHTPLGGGLEYLFSPGFALDAGALGYIRLTTHPRIMAEPLTAHEASADVESWLAQPQVTLLHPGEGHASTLFHLLRKLGTAGNLTTDAHLAALTMEYQATLHTTDADFARFSGLRWENPLP